MGVTSTVTQVFDAYAMQHYACAHTGQRSLNEQDKK
jgi:hypothetical protein